MSLEFVKLVDQVQKMGRFLGKRSQSVSSRLELALQWFYAAEDLETVHQRIRLVRESSVSGYRGAAPAPLTPPEIIPATFPAAPAPANATIAAADGSQIYPDAHAPALYYLVNIGVYVYFHGHMRLPVQDTMPELCYSDSFLYDADGRLVNNQTVNARRSVAEVEALALLGEELGAEARPLIALHDGGLLKFFGSAEVSGASAVLAAYMTALRRLHDTGAVLAGYLDRPRSTYLISLLHLLSLEPDQITDANLKTNGELEGLTDAHLYSHVLGPGERSAIMVQNSPQNHSYKQIAPEFEIAFFYLNLSDTRSPIIARVDIPMWVARSTAAVNDLQALLLSQSAIQGRRRYPYAITRADELAYVSGTEKGQLNELLNIEMLRNEVSPEASNKLQTKGLSRGQRQQHRIKR